MKTWKLTLILAALATIGPFSIDTYLPSFPAIGARFDATPAQVQQTLTAYLAAFAAMSLLHGSLADAWGRRRVILGGLAVYTVASLGCVLAPSFGWLLAFRALQGLASGAGLIVGRAIIRDTFEGAQAQRLLTHVTMLFGIAPAVAPVIGGWLHVGCGWQGPFFFLAAVGALLALMCVTSLPETLPVEQRRPLHPRDLAAGYGGVARDPRFLLLVAAVAFSFGGFQVYVATAADFVLNILGRSETEFAWLFVPVVAGLMVGSLVAGRILHRHTPERMILAGFAFAFTGALLNVAVNAAMAPRLPWVVLPLVFYTFGIAFLGPAFTLLALDRVPQRRGLASSVQGFGQTALFALVSAFVAPLVHGSALAHAAAQLGLITLSLAAWLLARRPSAGPPGAGL